MIDWDSLSAAAVSAQAAAYAPYSGYRVGAALLARDGRVFTGANVENRIFGLTICAERAALVAAVGSGATAFSALVVATESEPPAAPCGQCRDSLAEFASELPILLVNLDGQQRQCRLEDLLPDPFRLPQDPSHR